MVCDLRNSLSKAASGRTLSQNVKSGRKAISYKPCKYSRSIPPAAARPVLRSGIDFVIEAPARLSWEQTVKDQCEMSRCGASAFEACSQAAFRPSPQTGPILSFRHTAPECVPEKSENFPRGREIDSGPFRLHSASISAGRS